MSNDTELLHASVIKRIWKKCKEEDMDIVAFAWRIQREAERATPPPEAVRMSEAEIDALFNEHHNPQETPWANWRRFARAVEQATFARLGVKMGDV